MGRVHTITRSESAVSARTWTAARLAGAVLGSAALVLTLPLLAVLALAVRSTSHGRVLTREPAFDPNGRRVELYSFRTVLDGGNTSAHERVRAVFGDEAKPPVTRVGAFMRATRLDRLPRLYNLAAGHTRLF